MGYKVIFMTQSHFLLLHSHFWVIRNDFFHLQNRFWVLRNDFSVVMRSHFSVTSSMVLFKANLQFNAAQKPEKRTSS